MISPYIASLSFHDYEDKESHKELAFDPQYFKADKQVEKCLPAVAFCINFKCDEIGIQVI